MRRLTTAWLIAGAGLIAQAQTAPPGAPASAPTTAATPQAEADAAYARGDHLRAFRIYRALAERGDPVAQFNMGVMLDFGQGTAADAAQAVDWYRKAAAQGHAAAQFNLGGMYLDGSGVPKDPVRAAMWFTLAATAGVPGATKNRAAMRQMLTPEQAAEAARRASACQQSGFRDCD